MPRPLDRVRIGLIGAGFMAKAHSLAYDSASLLGRAEGLPAVERVRIADVRAGLAERAAAHLGWREATSDWRQITRADDIDLVDICAPNHLHAEIAVDAASHGKHVVCEKPLAHTADAAAEMCKAVIDAGVVHRTGFVFRTWPAVRLAKRLVDEGRLGRIHQFRGHYFHDYALSPEYSMGWRGRRETAGAGSIADLGSHVFDLARYLVGEICRVYARSRTLRHHRLDRVSDSYEVIDVDDESDILVEFEGGATGVVQTSWMATGYKTDLNFEVLGDRGSVRFTWCRNNALQIYSHSDEECLRGFRTVVIGPMHDGAREFWPVAGLGLGFGDAFVIAASELLSALQRGENVSPTFFDGLRASEIIQAALRSADGECWTGVCHEGAVSDPASSGSAGPDIKREIS